MAIKEFERGEPILAALNARGLEFDQRIDYAFNCGSKWMLVPYDNMLEAFFDDAEAIKMLIKSNPRCASLVDPVKFSELSSRKFPDYLQVTSNHPFLTRFQPYSLNIFNSIIERLSDSKTITTNAFVKSVAEQIFLHAGRVNERPYTADILAKILGHRYGDELPPSEFKPLLTDLEKLTGVDEDFQYILTFSYDGIAFRVTSVLDDYCQRAENGVLVPKRVLLTHFKKQYACFTQQEIEELQELINNPKAKEDAFQRFFEMYPHFLRKWDYRAVHPQVYLTTEEQALIPDFILTDNVLQRAAIIDLKRPKAKLIRHQDNRVRFANAVMEARAQLLEYRRYFENPTNRRKMRHTLCMDIYHPHLAVIIGRASEFQSALERQELAKDTPDIEVVTYDDILTYANQRRLMIES